MINQDRLIQTLKENKFDVVMHFAGLVKVEESLKNPEKYNFSEYNGEEFVRSYFTFRIEKLVISKQLQKIFSVNNIIDRIISSFPNSKSTNFNKLKIYL